MNRRAILICAAVGLLSGSAGIVAQNLPSANFLNLVLTGAVYTKSRVITASGDVTVGPTDYDISIAKAVSEPTVVTFTCAGTPNRVFGIKDDLGVDLQYPISVVNQSGTIDGQPATTGTPFLMARSTYGKPPYDYIAFKCKPDGANAGTR